MHNHDEKTKDMAESVLPSCARRFARAERRRIHQAQRARQRLALAELDPGTVGDFAPDFREGRRLSAIEWMVWERRAADKIGPLTRWAVAVVRAEPDLRDAGLDVQVEHFAALFPDNLIGRHAVQHIRWALEYETNRHVWQDRRMWSAQRQQQEHRAQVTVDVRRIVEAGAHGDLNDALRRHHQLAEVDGGKPVASRPARYLLGVHDIDAFAAEVAPDDGVRALIADLARKIG